MIYYCDDGRVQLVTTLFFQKNCDRKQENSLFTTFKKKIFFGEENLDLCFLSHIFLEIIGDRIVDYMIVLNTTKV